MVHPMEIGTNFDPALPGELSRFNRRQSRGRVVRAYGGLPADPVGGGRPGHRLPDVSLADVAAHVAALDAVGIGFSYTLNAPDLFGSQDDADWWGELDAFLRGIAKSVAASAQPGQLLVDPGSPLADFRGLVGRS